MEIQNHRGRPAAPLVVTLFLTLMTALPAFGQDAETLILFDAAKGETPESIVFDKRDNAYITMAFTGEIRKIGPDMTQRSLAFLPIGAPCGERLVVALGLAIDRRGGLYAAATACDPANSGIWKVDTETGDIKLLASPSNNFNGIDVHKGMLYAADTFGGLVWRVPTRGGTPEVWADDPLFKIAPGSKFPGPNGLQFYRGSIYVANSSTGDILEIPIERDGSAGQPSVHVASPMGCDEFTFDVKGRIYCTTDPGNTLLRLSPDGGVETLLTPEDLLDGPTSAAFGRKGANKQNLYITNAAFPMYSKTFRPSLMRLPIEVPGDPDEF